MFKRVIVIILYIALAVSSMFIIRYKLTTPIKEGIIVAENKHSQRIIGESL